ncbi:MAG: hypothetical protein K1X75_13130 [Leptospirales bacterium]|nr:hypothetical protein [Leptospirales bacterium]
MNPIIAFVSQFFWFSIVWTVVVLVWLAPAIRDSERTTQLKVWLTPQLFRVLGLGLTVENLAPALPQSFALPTAIGDSLTALLSLVAILLLHHRIRFSIGFAWACTLFGLLDLLIALPHAASIHAARYLHGQWFVPAVCVPLMLVCHVMALKALLKPKSLDLHSK